MKKRARYNMLLFLLFAMLIFDILGYVIIEGVDVLNALYMTIISITTVGFKEVFPLSLGGRIFTMLVIVTGIGFFFYIAMSVVGSQGAYIWASEDGEFHSLCPDRCWLWECNTSGTQCVGTFMDEDEQWHAVVWSITQQEPLQTSHIIGIQT